MAGTLTVQTLQGPSSGANANKLLIPSGQTLYAAGHVVQVVHNSTTTSVAVGTTTYTDTTLSASITPTSSNSKVLIILTQHVYNPRYGGSLRILRDATSIFQSGAQYAIYNDAGINLGERTYQTLNYLDTPSSTSLITYKTQFAHYTGGTTSYMQESGYYQSDITLLEIAQ